MPEQVITNFLVEINDVMYSSGILKFDKMAVHINVVEEESFNFVLLCRLLTG